MALSFSKRQTRRGRPRTDPCARFMAKVRERGDGCWEWTASVNGAGVPQFRISGQVLSARCAAWLLLNGERVPRTQQLVSRCGRPWCLRPEHMESVGRRGLARPWLSRARRPA